MSKSIDPAFLNKRDRIIDRSANRGWITTTRNYPDQEYPQNIRDYCGGIQSGIINLQVGRYCQGIARHRAKILCSQLRFTARLFKKKIVI